MSRAAPTAASLLRRARRLERDAERFIAAVAPGPEDSDGNAVELLSLQIGTLLGLHARAQREGGWLDCFSAPDETATTPYVRLMPVAAPPAPAPGLAEVINLAEHRARQVGICTRRGAP